jgi:hypothetical protein
MTPRLAVRRRTPNWGILAVAACLTAVLWGCGSTMGEEEQILRDALRTNFPTWKLVGEGDLSKDQLTRWKQEHAGQDPGVATGDYFGDSTRCFAVLITKQGEEGRRMRLAVLRPMPSGRFETFVLFTESPADTTPHIATSQAGEYQVFLGGQSVPVPTQGIVYTRGDGRQKLFFWNVDRFLDIELTE